MAFLVSVIMPAYNAAQWIADAIRSVLSQTYSNVELIVIDDGSTDGTADIVCHFGPTVRLCQQPHRGVAAARNAGLSLASGELIAQLDADDFWLPSLLETLVPYFSDPRIGVVSANIFSWDGTRALPPLPADSPPSATLLSGQDVWHSLLLRQDFFIPNSATLVRRSLLNQAGQYDEHLSRAEDFDLWLRIAQLNTYFVFVHEPLAIYRRRPDSLTSDLGARLDCHMRILQKWLSAPGLSRHQRRILYRYRRWRTRGYRTAAVQRLLAGNLPEAQRYFSNSLRHSFDLVAAVALLMVRVSPSLATHLIRILKRRLRHA
jgi:glycosyltransferase involved in cell wall biosynthesis